MAIEIGDKAPGFKLFNTVKKEVSLEDKQGKNVVLLFFPLAFTSTCTAELCAVRDDISDYNNADAEVLGISVDSLFVLNKYKQEQNLSFDLLSDFNKQASKDYDVLYPEFIFGMQGVSKRAVFVIDRQGIIRHKEVLEVAGNLPDLNAIKEILKTLK